MHRLELLIPPPVVALIVGLSMFGAARLLPQLSFAIPSGSTLALAIAACGLSIDVLAAITFFRHRTTLNPLKPTASSALVTTGIYRHTRNPMYVGLLLLLTAWATYLANLCAPLLLPAFVAYINRFQIRPEEAILLAKFGEPFSQYLSKTRRWA